MRTKNNVLSKIKKNITIFRLKTSIFTAVKYHNLLHRRVCYMFWKNFGVWVCKITPPPPKKKKKKERKTEKERNFISFKLPFLSL